MTLPENADFGPVNQANQTQTDRLAAYEAAYGTWQASLAALNTAAQKEATDRQAATDALLAYDQGAKVYDGERQAVGGKPLDQVPEPEPPDPEVLQRLQPGNYQVRR